MLLRLSNIIETAVAPALAILPKYMDSRKMERPEQARQRLPGLTTNQPVSEVRPMADANSRLPDARSANGTPLYKNACPDCGTVRLSDKRRLGKPCMSCANKRRATHGLVGHPLYKLLKGIEARCNHPSATNYRYYGGRGIRLCEEWANDPAAFVAWAQANGYAPGLELDRKDTDGPYAPWNCQFITHVLNSQKRRNQRCTEPQAARIREALAAGAAVKDAAAAAGVPYMVAWHISKGNTWKPSKDS